MNTHETYVNLETAKLLKQAGFDWEVEFFYQSGIFKSVLPDVLFNDNFEDIEYYYKHIGIPLSSINYNGGSSKFLEEYSAPTLTIAQRWLREVMDTYIIPQISDYEANGRIWEYDYRVGIHNINPIRSLYKYKSYEEALEAGIQNCLIDILNKTK